MGSDNRVRIIIAKLGLDGHDRGAKVLASMLQSEGYEVIYLGMYNTPEMLVQSAIQEDVDMIGVSYLSGEHLTLTPILMEELRKNKAEDLPVIVGGVVPPQDEEDLIKMGVQRVFRGSLVKDVVKYLNEYFK
ncbi:MAG: cobalamin B12-binding domain-containing protein [Deltaproteobacteria bacterium]|nr:cobalamin B12-binding domain-containing protein [Deltaproteobacteria bacterium]MBW1941968.1 cobalamin B12-binding domain-containing protein [Deltaproteobacteria bacterium]